MSNITTIPAAHRPARSVLISMAERYGMEAAAFEQTVRATCGAEKASREQFAAFLLVAKEYDLNPLTKEIYAFPTRSGGVQPIVSIDGWMNLINSHPQMNGLEFEDHVDDAGKVTSITARIWRKDREKPVEVTEYMAECFRKTEPWERWPRRMLRHKAAIQAARYAFGFAGIYDPDEAGRVDGLRDLSSASLIPPPPPADPAPPVTDPVVETATPDALPELADYEREISGWLDQIAAADDLGILSEVWECGPASYIEDGKIMPPDVERLQAAYAERRETLSDA